MSRALSRHRARPGAEPRPATLTGTNTWVVGRDPAWVVDPGPALAEHLDAVAAAVAARGGAGGIAVTHDHADHVEGLLALRERLGRPRVGARRYAADVRLGDGDRFGPFARPLRARPRADHLVFVRRRRRASPATRCSARAACSSPSGLGEYLDGAAAPARSSPLRVICPGHGPPVWRPARQARRVRRPPPRARAQAARRARGRATRRGRAARRGVGRRAAGPAAGRRGHAGGTSSEAGVRGSLASARRRYASVIAAASGVVPAASASSKIVRSVPPTARTRSSARSGA